MRWTPAARPIRFGWGWTPSLQEKIAAKLSHIAMKVFISSVYEDARVESDRRHLQIRAKLERFGFWVRPQIDPWIAEYYRRMLKTRERIGSSDSEIGEAMAELGYAEFAAARRLSLRGKSALARIREGVALLDSDHPERRPGFVVRAKHKLAQALEISGLADEAEQQRIDIETLRIRHGLPGD